MKHVDEIARTYIGFNVEKNDKDSEFKVGDQVRTSKRKNTFSKSYTPNWSEPFLMIKKLKNTISWRYITEDLNGEERFGTYYEKETNQIEFRVEKVIKRKGDTPYVKWKGYDNSFNNCTDEQDTVYHILVVEVKKIELDLSNYATKSDVKNATGVDASKFAKKGWFN